MADAAFEDKIWKPKLKGPRLLIVWHGMVKTSKVSTYIKECVALFVCDNWWKHGEKLGKSHLIINHSNNSRYDEETDDSEGPTSKEPAGGGGEHGSVGDLRNVVLEYHRWI